MDDYIAHRRSGLHYETKASHKYYKRIETGNKKKPYLYFYSKAEYDAYLKGSKGNGKNKKQKTLKKIRSLLNKTINSFKKTVDKDGNGKWDIVEKIEDVADTDKNGRWDVIDKADAAIKKHSSKNKKSPKAPSSKTNPKPTPKTNKDTNSKNHKYIAKLLINGKYRYFYTEAELNAYYNKNPEARAEREVMKAFDLIDTPETEAESMAEVNKNFQKSMSDDGVDLEPGWSTNCYICSLAWEARCRGYDVEAQYDPNGGTDEEISSFYEGVKSYVNSDGSINFDSGWDLDVAIGQKASNGKETMKETAKMLGDKYEDGARGCLDLYWQGGGAHMVSWEKKDGEIYIHDAQNNTTEKMEDYSKAEYVAPNQTVALRTDDKALTKKAASYLEPNDNVDEAKTNKKLTFNYDVKDIDNMLDHYNPTTNTYESLNQKDLRRWQEIIDKDAELKDMDYWNQEKVKKEVYGDE